MTESIIQMITSIQALHQVKQMKALPSLHANQVFVCARTHVHACLCTFMLSFTVTADADTAFLFKSKMLPME
jgi:hypothetical protein